MKTRHQLARQILPACLLAALLLTLHAAPPAPARVVVVPDVHGAYTELVALLQRTRLIDGNLKWTGGSTTLVQLGDVIDRGARSRECLDLLMSLERQAPKAGGKVIPLLGNHEVMNVMGDLRYVTPEIYRTFVTGTSEKRREQAFRDYLGFLAAHDGRSHPAVPPPDETTRQAWMDQHPPGFVEYRDGFGPAGKYGRWIRAHHAVVQIDDGLFLHGGLNPTLEFGSVRELDDRVRAELAAFDSIWSTLVDSKVVWRYMTLAEGVRFAEEELKWLQAGGETSTPAGDRAALKLLGYQRWMAASPEGPLWYRGLAEAPEEGLIDAVKAMLERLQARYIVLGHTVVSKTDVTVRFGDRVFLLDTGMLEEAFGGRATLLEIRDGQFTAYHADGSSKSLPVPPARSLARSQARASRCHGHTASSFFQNRPE